MGPGFLAEELTAFRGFFRENFSETIIILSALFSLVLFWYHPISGDVTSNIIYFCIIPVAVIRFILREPLTSFGLCRGEWRRALGHVFYGSVFLFLPAQIYFSFFDESIRAYYLAQNFQFPSYVLRTAAQLWCWEFFLRGFLLFGLAKRFGQAAILIQVLPFTMLHFGKPCIETLFCIVWGVYLGFAAYRSRSMWPAYLLHLIANVCGMALVNF